jgi:hypothetical protein
LLRYTGNGSNATIGHGLGVAPKLIIVKEQGGCPELGGVSRKHWEPLKPCISIHPAKTTLIQDTWNNTAPTSTVFSVLAQIQATGGFNK